MAKMSIRGVSLFEEVMGHGYPIALMHGGPGLDYQTMLPLQPLEVPDLRFDDVRRSWRNPPNNRRDIIRDG